MPLSEGPVNKTIVFDISSSACKDPHDIIRKLHKEKLLPYLESSAILIRVRNAFFSNMYERAADLGVLNYDFIT